MKLLGLQKIDGGLAVALPSGRQILVALPDDRMRAALVLGERLLEVLADPTEPHASQGVPGSATDQGTELDDSLAAIDAGLEVGRMVWDAVQRVRRGR